MSESERREWVVEEITAGVWDRPAIETRDEFKAAINAMVLPLLAAKDAEIALLRIYVEEDAAEPCEYGCDCPAFSACHTPRPEDGSRRKSGCAPHGPCRSCMARSALSSTPPAETAQRLTPEAREAFPVAAKLEDLREEARPEEPKDWRDGAVSAGMPLRCEVHFNRYEGHCPECAPSVEETPTHPLVEDHAFEECKESAYHCTLTLLHPPHTGAYCHRMIPGTLRPEVEMPCGKPRCAHAPAPTLPLIESKE